MSKRASSFHFLALVALTCALAACNRNEPPKPQTAPAATATSPAFDTRTREQAMAALMALPELKAWSSQIEKSSGGTARGALIEYDPAPRIIDGNRYWQVSFVANGADAAQHWESFLVAERGADILVDDSASGQTLTLAQWRKDKRPLARTGSL